MQYVQLYLAQRFILNYIIFSLEFPFNSVSQNHVITKCNTQQKKCTKYCRMDCM